VTEFPLKNWKSGGLTLNKLGKKTGDNESTAWLAGSGRRRTARTDENAECVGDDG